jgi:hypothetical protein
LNLYHHFFNGLERVLGCRVVEELTNAKKFYEDDTTPYVDVIVGLMRGEFASKGDPAVDLVAQMMKNTMEVQKPRAREEWTARLLVVANVYAFDYIETGQTIGEADVRMWLSTAAISYRTHWFAAFKDSGVPLFAYEGVQNRYALPLAQLGQKKKSVMEPTEEEEEEYHRKRREERLLRRQEREKRVLQAQATARAPRIPAWPSFRAKS